MSEWVSVSDAERMYGKIYLEISRRLQVCPFFALHFVYLSFESV